jgi:hypothetical protein
MAMITQAISFAQPAIIHLEKFSALEIQAFHRESLKKGCFKKAPSLLN